MAQDWPSSSAEPAELTPAGQAPARRRKVDEPESALSVLKRHGKRLTSFSLIGGFVFVAGLVFQVALVRLLHQGPDSSYAWQAGFSIELSYLLNRYLTWKDQKSSFWRALWKFNVQKLLMTAVNMVAYALLVYLGVQYLVANILLTAIFTPINYFASHLLVFVRSYRGKRRKGSHADSVRGVPGYPGPAPIQLPNVLPSVSIVIPCKSSEKTIRATVLAFLGQDYPALKEVILVGDVNDSTWTALRGIGDPRLIIIEQEKTPGRRDPNVKRHQGIMHATGDILALGDSDIVMDPDWLPRAISLLYEQGGGLVAGGMRSIHNTFWGRFVDSNMLAAKTPRLSRPYRVTRENFGKRGFKPPITANAVFTRDLYGACPLDVDWAYGYEDYEWFWRLARQGHAILYDGALTAAHHHRRSFRQLVREYKQSAHGCAQFVRAHPDSPLARKRKQQAYLLPVLAGVSLIASIAAVASGFALELAVLLLAAAVLLSSREAIKSRSLEALTYTPAAFALAGIFTWSLAGNLMHHSPSDRGAPTWSATRTAVSSIRIPSDNSRSSAGLDETSLDLRNSPRRISWPLVAVLLLQTALSVRLIVSNTVFADEGLYLWAGHIEISHWLHNLPWPTNQKSFVSYFSGAPQIYSPIGAIADKAWQLTGPRLLSLVFMLAATLFLYLSTTRIVGKTAAIIAAALWAVSEPALKLGALATYDPMTVFLMSLAVYVITSPRHQRRHGELVALSGAVMAFGCLTTYSYLIYVPIITVMAMLIWAPRRGVLPAIASGLWMAACTVAGFALGATVLHLWPGIMSEILSRQSGDSGMFGIVVASWTWVGLLFTLAIGGSLASKILGSKRALLFLVLASSAVVVPIQNVRIETGTALEKHISVGLLLASISAAYLLDECSRQFIKKSPAVSAILGGILLLAPAVGGLEQAYDTFHIWPDSTRFAAKFNALSVATPGKFLVEHPGEGLRSISEYYSPIGIDWWRWGDVSWGASSIPGSQRLTYYRQELSQQSFGIIAVFLPWKGSSPSIGTAYFTPQAQPQLLQSITNDPAAPGMYDLVSAIIASHRYRLIWMYSEGGHTPGTFVIWRKIESSTKFGTHHSSVRGRK